MSGPTSEENPSLSHTDTDSTPERPAASLELSRRKWRWLRVRGFLPLSLPPLLAACGIATYGAVAAYQGQPIATQGILWSLTMMATALSACALVLGWHSGRWHVADLRRQLEQLTVTGKTEMITLAGDGDLVELAAAMNIYIAQLQKRSVKLNLHKKELDIQTRIAEAEKRCVETVVEKIADPVIVTDAFDEVVLANRAAQQVFGFILGAADRQPIHRAIRNPAMVQLIKSMRDPDDPPQRNIRINLNSDTANPQTFRASLTRVVDPRGNVHGVVTVLRSTEHVATRHPSRVAD